MEVELFVLGLAILAAVALAAENRYGQRKGRTLPHAITEQMVEFPVTRGRFKRVDLEMDDGRTFEGVWVVDDRWPTFSPRRALNRFEAAKVASVREHLPTDDGA